MMRFIPAQLPMAALAALIAPHYVGATSYLTIAQAQQAIFPASTFTQVHGVLTEAQREQMRERSGVREPFKAERIWRVTSGANQGAYFIIDEVVGKHEMIQYALGINADGSVRGVEIMEYNESYGYEIRELAWRQQFVGKTVSEPVKLNKDIRNVSGATLSCKHVTDGVKRLLVMHELALKAKT